MKESQVSPQRRPPAVEHRPSNRRQAQRLEPRTDEVPISTPARSGRVPRGVLHSATELFAGNEQAAMDWLLDPQWALGGVTPAEVAQTPGGVERVRTLIGQLLHGVLP